jgi:hypothetical protein
MKISEIVDLIHVRNYVANSINNHSLKRDSVNQLNTTLILLDKMLVSELTGSTFKDKIHFENAKEAVQEVVETTNIKFNMKPSSKIVVVNEDKVEVK